MEGSAVDAAMGRDVLVIHGCWWVLHNEGRDSKE
jgi:hypothetical protein